MRRMATKSLLVLFLLVVLLTTGCGILKGNSCGCPTIPTSGKMRH